MKKSTLIFRRGGMFAAETLLVLLVVVACQKETPDPGPSMCEPFSDCGCPGRIYFSGQVLDSLTGAPLPGLIVWQPTEYVSSKQADTSDANGNFLVVDRFNPCAGIPLYRPAEVSMYLHVGQNYYSHYETLDVTAVPDNDTVQRNIYAIPFSHINVHVTGTSDQGQVFSVRNNYSNPPEIVDNEQELGSDVDTTVTFKGTSNRTNQIELYVNGALHSVTPVATGYGSTENISISYP